MEPNKQSPLLPRDPRGSLEVFNPSTTYSTRPTNPVFGRNSPKPSSWQNWSSAADVPPEAEEPQKPAAAAARVKDEGISTTWMALQEPPVSDQQKSPKTTISSIIKEKEGPAAASKSQVPSEVGAAAQRAAEWGLVLKTDDETGKLQGVKVRTSGGDEQHNKAGGNSRRDSGNSVRSSGDSSDDGLGNKLIIHPNNFSFLIYNYNFFNLFLIMSIL